MILTRNEILKLVRKKKIIIEPFDDSAVGPASVDLTLGSELRVFTRGSNRVKVEELFDYKSITKPINIERGYCLKPGELVLGITKEKITLPGNVCGFLQSRSRFARLGLMSHISAPFICPGVSNHQVLEIFNAGPKKMLLIPGVKICQLTLHLCKGKASYQGKFRDQTL